MKFIAKTNAALIFILLSLLPCICFTSCQRYAAENNNLENKLSAEHGSADSGIAEFISLLEGKDSTQAVAIMDELLKKADSSNDYFNARFFLSKAVWLSQLGHNGVLVRQLLNQSLHAAFETENDSLISLVSWKYGSLMYDATEYGLSSVYCLFGLETDEKTGRRATATEYSLLGDLFFRTQEYPISAFYTNQAIHEAPNDIQGVMSWYNTLGLCWEKLKNYDSAFVYFDLAASLSRKANDTIWQSIISGNIGQVYFHQKKYALAKPLLEADYRRSKSYGEINSAANSLQWVARINLAEGKRDSALMQSRLALELLLKKRTNDYYLENAYYATAAVYRALGNWDSAYAYQQCYETLHENMEEKLADSRLGIARVRLDNLKNELLIKNLNKEKKSEEFKRNAIIAGLIMLSIITILYVNSLRVKLRHKMEIAAEQSKMAAVEVQAAKEKLDLFTSNIIEKSNLIEILQQRVKDRDFDSTQQQLVDQLLQQSILTEDDWERFKKLFDKIHPGFFRKLKEKASDITVAEQRMAALTRLQLETRQIASMLGISVDSVHKSRQRLRQRFNFSAETDLKEFLARL